MHFPGSKLGVSAGDRVGGHLPRSPSTQTNFFPSAPVGTYTPVDRLVLLCNPPASIVAFLFLFVSVSVSVAVLVSVSIAFLSLAGGVGISA